MYYVTVGSNIEILGVTTIMVECITQWEEYTVFVPSATIFYV